MRTKERPKKLEHYCYLRTNKASGEWSENSKERKYYLFWMNRHLQIGELLYARNTTSA